MTITKIHPEYMVTKVDHYVYAVTFDNSLTFNIPALNRYNLMVKLKNSFAKPVAVKTLYAIVTDGNRLIYEDWTDE